MTRKDRRTWVTRVKAHIDTRLKEACREGLQAYWPVGEKYDPEVAPEGRQIYQNFKRALAKAMREVKL